jgi:hypothetical protein
MIEYIFPGGQIHFAGFALFIFMVYAIVMNRFQVV